MRQATAKPIVCVGRFTNPDTMADLVRSGDADLIGAARPSIADPFLPRKIEEGRYGEVRECIGCNFCYSRAEYGGHLGCTQNATAGEEYRRRWHPERFGRAEGADRDVLVLGAGAAGLECAIVLAKRGFGRVHVVEAEGEIGGTTRWLRRLPGLGEWGRVLDWRAVQLERLKGQIEVVTGVRLGPDEVLEYGAELVVVATGSYWAADGLSGQTAEPLVGADASLPFVLTPEQVMLEGKRPPGERVVVYDCEGYFLASSLAELLRAEGHDVLVATPYEQVAPICHETLEAPRLRHRLHELGIRLATETVLTVVEPDAVSGVASFGEPVRFETNAVVLVTQRLPRDAVYREIAAVPAEDRAAAGVEGVFRVGDCVAPRMLGDAIFDGHRLGREIDGPHPAVPLPYTRERLVVGR